jgi:probable F420-dependent oxidoreductase
MRFSVQLPTHRVDAGDEFVSGAALAEMARAAERAGFGACFVTDHPFPGDRWLAGGGHHSLDPFVALSFAAAATVRIRVQTHILVLPYRNPFAVAKAAASLDVLSGGRLVLGVAPGYLKSEFQALGADFERRNEATDEAMRAIVKAWTETGIAFEGHGYTARGNTMLPRPVQRPHPPLWVGGNSEAAIRRAARLGDGWVPFPTPRQAAPYQRTAAIETLDDLAARLDRLREYAERAGRTRALDVCFAPFGADMHTWRDLEAERVLEQAAALEKLGVTWMALSPPADSRAAWCDAVAALGAGLGPTA